MAVRIAGTAESRGTPSGNRGSQGNPRFQRCSSASLNMPRVMRIAVPMCGTAPISWMASKSGKRLSPDRAVGARALRATALANHVAIRLVGVLRHSRARARARERWKTPRAAARPWSPAWCLLRFRLLLMPRRAMQAAVLAPGRVCALSSRPVVPIRPRLRNSAGRHIVGPDRAKARRRRRERLVRVGRVVGRVRHQALCDNNGGRRHCEGHE